MQYLIVTAVASLGREIYRPGRYLVTDQEGPGKRISNKDAETMRKAGKARFEGEKE